jgi:hypothetical protein
MPIDVTAYTVSRKGSHPDPEEFSMRRLFATLSLSALAALAGCTDDSGAPRVAEDAKPAADAAAPAATGPKKAGVRTVAPAAPATAGGAATVRP